MNSNRPRPLARGRLFVHMGSGRSDLSQFGVLAERRGIEGGSQEGPLLYIILKRSFRKLYSLRQRIRSDKRNGQIEEKHGEQFFHDGTAFLLCGINTNRIIAHKLYNLQSSFPPIVIVAILLLTWYNVYVQICPPGTGGGAADPLSEKRHRDCLLSGRPLRGRQALPA